jgi:hypothetical protein
MAKTDSKMTQLEFVGRADVIMAILASDSSRMNYAKALARRLLGEGEGRGIFTGPHAGECNRAHWQMKALVELAGQ